MTTLKEHQASMVDLLANGSGIPASASRLAHAMHDLIEAHLAVGPVQFYSTDDIPRLVDTKRPDATTPGLNDKALSKPVAATKTDGHATRPAPAEVRVKELQNTIRQLKENNAKLKGQYASCFKSLEEATLDCQNLQYRLDCAENEVMCLRSITDLPEQAGVRKEDTQMCEHEWKDDGRVFASCAKCGAAS